MRSRARPDLDRHEPAASGAGVRPVTPDLGPEAVERAAVNFRRSDTPFHPRSLPAFHRFFDGLELLGPGVIPVSGRRPEPADVAVQAEGAVPVYGRSPARSDPSGRPEQVRSRARP
ncbi:SAM-dependent methyltransferase [Streptomyces sp900105755]|uniref:SAM-dependent methyltransferase n=1 Tax=Streptomyces sp. 900105755 TaxID=3154389 RepID=UPI003325CDC4